jgi:hypothetical protein
MFRLQCEEVIIVTVGIEASAVRLVAWAIALYPLDTPLLPWAMWGIVWYSDVCNWCRGDDGFARGKCHALNVDNIQTCVQECNLQEDTTSKTFG